MTAEGLEKGAFSCDLTVDICPYPAIIPFITFAPRKRIQMKILILGAQERYEKYLPQLPFIRQQELVFWD